MTKENILQARVSKKLKENYKKIAEKKNEKLNTKYTTSDEVRLALRNHVDKDLNG